jgi:hypothetical protein
VVNLLVLYLLHVVIFNMLCLDNCNLTLNLIGEFMSLYGIMERFSSSFSFSFGGKYYLVKSLLYYLY